ncbi:MAG: rhomboid family intramembrane serine protease [Lewinella sp.]|nr:rhomboid family intramembrane serine protease [Lewinella sp.]
MDSCPALHTHRGQWAGVCAGCFSRFQWFFRRDFRAIVISLLVLFYYGGMVSGVLPGQEGISWESHLFGFICGLLSAYGFRNDLEDHERRARERAAAKAARQAPTRPFLAADTFTETKAQREQRLFWENIQEAAQQRERRQGEA